MKAVIKKLNLRTCSYCGAIAEYTINNIPLCSHHFQDESKYIKSDKTGYSARFIKSNWQTIQGKINKELASKVKKNLLISEFKSIRARLYIIELLENYNSGKIDLTIDYDNNHTLRITYGDSCYICLVPVGYIPDNLTGDLISGKVKPSYIMLNGTITGYYQ